MKKLFSYVLAIPVFLITLSGFGNLFMGDFAIDVYIGLFFLAVGFIGILLLYKYGKF
jgi:hypothetical protein